VVPDAANEGGLASGLVQWAVGCLVVYLGLFGIGHVVLGRPGLGALILAVAVALTAYLVRSTRIQSPTMMAGGVGGVGEAGGPAA
jgi:hypothetical protein